VAHRSDPGAARHGNLCEEYSFLLRRHRVENGTSRHFAPTRQRGRFWSEVDMNRPARLAGSVENDPSRRVSTVNCRMAKGSFDHAVGDGKHVGSYLDAER
jgi:hypothetical protein